MPHARQFAHQAGHATHVFHLAQLLKEVGQVETVAFLQLGCQFLGLRAVNFALDIFDKRQHVTHAENTGSDTVRVERLQRFGFLADAEEFNRLAGDMTNRQRRAAAGVAVDFGQHHAGQRQRFVKGLRGIRRILTGHRIDDEQRLNRVNRGVDLFDFVHHRFINVQTAGGIHQQHVVEFQLRFFQRRVDDINRLLANVGREEIHADLLCQRFQLFNRRRAVYVRGNDQHFFLVLLAQEFAQLTDAGRFTRTLQARHQDDGRRLRG